MSEAAGPTMIGSVRRALHLLDAVCASERPATARQLAHTLKLPLPTVYHLLRTLVYEGYLRKLDDGYVLGGRADGLRQGNARQATVGRALFDPATHFSCSGIIAEGYPPALGQALAFRKRGTDRIAVAVTGEGAANQGAFHESLNLAALWKLPVVFIVEDNGPCRCTTHSTWPTRSPARASTAR